MALNQAERHFSKLCQTMVDTQLRPNHITDPAVLDAFSTVRRDFFVPKESELISYCDSDVPLGNERYLLSPLTLATLLQNLKLQPTDKVLVVGCGYGLSVHLLKTMGINNVFGVDEACFIEEGLRRSPTLPIFEGTLAEGLLSEAPFDIILIEGAIQLIPQAILQQVTHKIACLILNKAQTTGTIFTKQNLTPIFTFDTAGHELKGFLKKATFRFG